MKLPSFTTLSSLLGLVVALSLPAAANAGSIVLTGHDPDFHAILGGNAIGARNINTSAINYVMDAGYNPFVATASKFLFVESTIATPGGHTIGMNGIIASGYAQGTDFDRVNAAGLNAALNLLGTAGGYSAIVIASDFGGLLTQAELNILNSRSADIISFLNSGGGLYAMAEGNGGTHLTPGGGHYGYLPFVVTSSAFDQSEIGNTVSALGTSMGLTDADINGNASHIFFSGTGGMQAVDYDSAGHILTLATRSQITTGGVVPEPGSIALSGLALVALGASRRRRN